MGYNRSVFNQTIFNQRAVVEPEGNFYVEGFETVDCISKILEIISLDAIGYESVAFQAIVTQSYVLEPEGFEKIACQASGYSLANLNVDAISDISATTMVVFVGNLSSEGGDTIVSNSEATFILNAQCEAEVKLNCECKAGLLFRFNAEGYEIINCDAILDDIQKVTLIANVSIPPGGKLVVDAKYYTAYLNGTNVIDKITGDWLDELNRESIEIQIDCGNSNKLKTLMLYEELYL